MVIRFTDTSDHQRFPILPQELACYKPYPSVIVRAEAYRQALQHLSASTTEQGGLLIGQAWCASHATDQVAVIDIMEAIPCMTSVSSAFALKMSAGVWSDTSERLAHLNHELAPKGQALRIVGWFHSHPNLGAFFSPTDMATQADFFYHPYSVGWVMDPFDVTHSRHQAFFLGASGTPITSAIVLPPT
jgi:proteasome lid subunit RPN8/RPN11